MFVGGKVVEAIELEARQVDLEARLLESENLVHHFQSVIRNRDQELNSTKRVSTHTEPHSQCKKINKVIIPNVQTALNTFEKLFSIYRIVFIFCKNKLILIGSCMPDRVS